MAMMQGDAFDEAALGPAVRSLREQRGLSLRELARRVGVSASALSQIETGKARPSVVTLYAIVNALQTTLDVLFEVVRGGGPAGLGAPRGVELLRAEDQPVFQLGSGESWRRFASRAELAADCLILTYPASVADADHADFVQHTGREVNLVISGRLAVAVDGEVYLLGVGDSIALNAEHPHRITNPGRKPAEVVTIFKS